MSKAKITASAPVLLVKDLLKSTAYFHNKLGFADQKLYGNPPDFAMVSRDNFTVMLAQADTSQTLVPHWKIVSQMWNIYFWVDDVEALYAEFQSSGAIIDCGLGIKNYNVKEFGVQDLDDHDIAFGQILK